MDFMTSIKTCLAKYADFSGRARRSEYWWFFLAVLVVEQVFRFISTPLYYLVVLAFIVPGIAVGIRRMHDVGKSGWFILIPIYDIVLAATESTPGANQYGPNPKELEAGQGTPPPGYAPPSA
jgi:uncharacterized membrane protein YhaH (DUF805 family)